MGRNLERGDRATQRCAVSRTATSDSVSGPSQETHLGKSALPGVGDEGERGSAFCLRCYSTRGMVQASSPLERQTSWFKVVGYGSGSNSVEPQSVTSPTQERVHPSVSFAEWAGPRPSKLRARGLGTLSWASTSGGYSLDTQAGGRPRVPCISQGVRGSL